MVSSAPIPILYVHIRESSLVLALLAQGFLVRMKKIPVPGKESSSAVGCR